jgi:hypothetical protein
MNQTNLREIKIAGKSDRLMVWNRNRFNFEEWKNEKRECQFGNFLFQPETRPYDLETKRLWVYVNQPENKLKYVFGLKPLRPGELPIDPNCHNESCCEDNRKFSQRKWGQKMYAYELTLIHEFKKGNTLLELQKYKHQKSGKYLFAPRPTRSHVYVSSYPDLVKDIITGKIS